MHRVWVENLRRDEEEAQADIFNIVRGYADAQMGRVTRVLSRARRQCRGRFYRLTDCYPLEDGGVPLIFKKALGRDPRVDSEGGR